MSRYIFLVVLFSTVVFARSDALIVGVSIYKDSGISKLTGVKYDMKNIRKVLYSFNVPPNHIKELNKTRATLGNVRKAFKSYISCSEKNHKDNLFIFYFSGHGVQVTDVSGDEQVDENGKYLDEASVLYNARTTDGLISQGVLLDDELYTWLSKIKSKKVLIFDKCHSDSSYRDVKIGYEKVIKGTFELSKNFIKSMNALPKVENSVTNTFVISATQDKEIAEDSPLGGLFTQSLVQGIVYKKAFSSNGSLTLGELEKFCNSSICTIATDIRRNFKGTERIKGAFHPRFRPNMKHDLTLATIFDVEKYSPAPINKEKTPKKKEQKFQNKTFLLEDTLDQLSNERIIQSSPLENKRNYTQRESVTINIRSKKSGYLNVLVAHKDSYKLFTKEAIYIKANIKAKKPYRFPEDFYSNEALRAKKPFGKTKVYLFLSRKPWDIQKDIMALKSDDLELTNNFRKELMPSVEYEYLKKKDQVRIQKVKPNILGISRVHFNVTSND